MATAIKVSNPIMNESEKTGGSDHEHVYAVDERDLEVFLPASIGSRHCDLQLGLVGHIIQDHRDVLGRRPASHQNHGLGSFAGRKGAVVC